MKKIDYENIKLTDKERRIFLAAIGREEEVCKEIDAKTVREPYEDTLVSICRHIKWKIMHSSLWD